MWQPRLLMVNGGIYYIMTLGFGKAPLPEDNNLQNTSMRWKRICASRPAVPSNLPGVLWLRVVRSDEKRLDGLHLNFCCGWQNWRTSRRVGREPRRLVYQFHCSSVIADELLRPLWETNHFFGAPWSSNTCAACVPSQWNSWQWRSPTWNP